MNPDNHHDVEVEFPEEGVTTTITVTVVGAGLLRLESVPLLVEGAIFGDTIRVTQLTPSLYRFEEVAASGGWKQLTFTTTGPGAVQDFITEIERRGARWELVFGGVLTVCVPPNLSNWDVEADARRLIW